jgi:hypothetical protein
MTYLRKNFVGPLLQDNEIFGGISLKVMGRKNFFNACSEVGCSVGLLLDFTKSKSPLTEAVLPDSGNYKTIVSLCYQLL